MHNDWLVYCFYFVGFCHFLSIFHLSAREHGTSLRFTRRVDPPNWWRHASQSTPSDIGDSFSNLQVHASKPSSSFSAGKRNTSSACMEDRLEKYIETFKRERHGNPRVPTRWQSWRGIGIFTACHSLQKEIFLTHVWKWATWTSWSTSSWQESCMKRVGRCQVCFVKHVVLVIWG